MKYILVFLLLVSLIFSHAPAGSNEKQASLEWTKYYAKPYNFSLDNTFRSFISTIPVWTELLSPFKGKPDIHYLEIGVNQGRSAMWMLENILTHPSARLTGIDIFPEGTDFKERYLSNLQLSGFAHKAITIEGFSQTELRSLPLNSFDIIYIDGDHKADGVMADAVLSFGLLRDGGILIFDDYLWFEKQLPEELIPRIAVDSFITSYRNSLEVIYRGYQMFIRKREGFCDRFPIPPIGCSPVGQYIYVWNWDFNNQLYSRDTDEPLELSDREKVLIEQLINSTVFGNSNLLLESTVAQDEDFKALSERLKLEFTNIEIVPEKGFFEGLRQQLFPSSSQ